MEGKPVVVLDCIAPLKVNINGSADPYYRYKMPQLVLRHVKDYTLFHNLDAVAKALAVPASNLFCHLVRALCASKGRGFSVRGKHPCGIVSRALTAFIVSYVICPACGLPELRKERCAACGNIK